MAKLLPLFGKYYGTIVELNDGAQIEVWVPNQFTKPFGSSREIAEGWIPSDGHDHVEDERSLQIAQAIVEFCNSKNW